MLKGARVLKRVRRCVEERVLELGYIRRVIIGDLMLLPAQLASSVNLQEKRREGRDEKVREHSPTSDPRDCDKHAHITHIIMYIGV